MKHTYMTKHLRMHQPVRMHQPAAGPGARAPRARCTKAPGVQSTKAPNIDRETIYLQTISYSAMGPSIDWGIMVRAI
jgi:hypothetical protein